MKISRTVGTLVGAAALVLSAACSQDLSVTNPNNPDQARATANANDVQHIALSAVNSWYNGSTARDPWVMFNVTGDLMTMNYGNFGARFNNLQPRIPYANSATNGDIEVAQVPWENQYATLGLANDVLRAIKGGLQLPGGTDKYKALAMFAQAGALMQLALVYDKAFIVDENFDATKDKPELKPYPEVAKAAQDKLDALIALTATPAVKSASWDQSEIPLYPNPLTGAYLNQFANTMAAQLLAYTPRTAAEAAKVDWAKVLQYANNGITQDFVIAGDGSFRWWSEFMGYFDLPSWMRIDQKLVHRMCPSVPPEFDGKIVDCTGPHDARLGSEQKGDYKTSPDFAFVGYVIGDPNRGIYMQSPFIHQRYIDVSWQADVSFAGPMPYTLAAENDLLKAEALIRTGGDRQAAADLVNKTRVGRGQLDSLRATDNDSTFLADIEYEREVELDATNGFGFFALRHMDDLREGTVRHLPVPATELETDGLPVYTFGGVGNPDMNVLPASTPLIELNLHPGQTRQLELPNGEIMQLDVPPKPRRPQPPTIF